MDRAASPPSLVAHFDDVLAVLPPDQLVLFSCHPGGGASFFRTKSLSGAFRGCDDQHRDHSAVPSAFATWFPGHYSVPSARGRSIYALAGRCARYALVPPFRYRRLCLLGRHLLFHCSTAVPQIASLRENNSRRNAYRRSSNR